MEIRIDNQRLDFAGDFKYKKNNQIFSFDALTADRTVSIKIPRTRRNAMILAHGERAEADGSQIRSIHSAVVLDGAIAHTGRLYITKADESGYTAVFCFGSVEALRSVNGRMRDLVSDRLSQATDTPTDADFDGTTLPFHAIRYQQQDVSAKYLPSFSVSVLLREAAASVGVSLALPSEVEQLRVLPSKAAGMKEQTISFVSTATTPPSVIGVDADPSAPGNVPEPVLALLPVVGTEVLVATEMITQDSVGTNVTHHEVRTEVRGWKALQSCTLTFPFDFPEDLYLIEVRSNGTVFFLGGYSFGKIMTMDEDEECVTPTWTGGQAPIDYGGIDGITIRTSDRVSSITGEPLAGRSVNINAGTTFLFVTPSAFLSADSEVPAPAGYYDDWRCSISGWVFGGDGLTYDETVTVKGEDEVLDGQVALHDQLGDDDTLVAWLQDIAAITGTILRYDEVNGLWFDVADMDGWETIDIKRLVGWKDTERKMLDFGQTAEVKFRDDKNSSGASPVEYKTYNDTLTERTTVRELLYSGGSAGLPAGTMLVRNGDHSQDVGIYCLTNPDGDGGGEDMSRVRLTPNDTITRLASVSTRQVRTAMMSAVEVEQVKPDTLLVSGGQRWAWTEANVSGQSVQWTLQKVGGGSVPPPVEVFAVQSFSPSEPNYNAAVMRICYAHGLSALADRMTMAEAAAVTAAQISTGSFTIFSPYGDADAANILSFNEFQYFTGVTSVQASAFRGTSQMASLTLPSSVTSTGQNAFIECHSLTALTLNEGLTSFNGVGSVTAANVPQRLTELTLPSSVTTLAINALRNSKIVTLTCLATTPPTATAAYCLKPMTSLTSIKVPSASVEVYKAAAGWSQHATKITAI